MCVSRCKCCLILKGHGYQPCRKNAVLLSALAAEALVEVPLESAAPSGLAFSCRARMARLIAVLLQNLSSGLGHSALHSSQ